MPVKHRAASSRPYLSSTRKATTTTANQTSVKQDKTLSRLAKTQADGCETKRTGRDGGLTSSATLFMK